MPAIDPDWTLFRTAYLRGLPRSRLLAALRKIRSWLDLPLADATAALPQEKDFLPRELYQACNIMAVTLQREMGIPFGPAAQEQMQQLFAKVGQGAGSEQERRWVSQLWTAWQLMAALLKVDPTLSQPVSVADRAKTELQRAANLIFDRLNHLPGSAPGSVSAESISALEGIEKDFQALAAQAAPENAALPDIFYGLGQTALSLAKSCIIAGRNDQARIHFSNSADYFNRAGQPEKAAASRSQLKAFEQQLSGALDETATENLQSLVAAEIPADPIVQIGALINLANVAAHAFDVFEALQQANAASVALEKIGYDDPLKNGIETAMAGWIATAAHELTGVPFLGRLNQVGTWYLSIFSARYADVVRNDAAEADRLETLQTNLQKAFAKFQTESAEASAEQDREWQFYFPAPPATPDPKTTASKTDFEAMMDRMRAVDTHLADIRERCNQRIGTGQPMDDLLGELDAIQAEGDAFATPIYAAKTRLEKIYVLGHLGRAAEILPIARDARERLLAGRAPSLGSFSQSFERSAYLQTFSGEVNAFIMLRDFASMLSTSETVIRDFEKERYRVNNPYRTSALLSSVADFYKWAAFAAFKLERWDNMLEAIELIKARSAIHSRLLAVSDITPEKETRLRLQFDEVGAALSRDPANSDLAVRRRQLWDLLSTLRTTEGSTKELPEFKLAAVQGTLAEDEALIGYFWLSDMVVLALLVDRQQFHAERIMLQADEAEQLGDFITFVRELKSASGRVFDKAVERLGAVLLPDFVRAFMASKKRIVFSPHHALHLFPFHAARWDDKEYIGTRFAVRYVPNFSSLLLPWAARYENRVFALAIKAFSAAAVPELENVEADVDAIANFYTERGATTDILKGKDATRSRFENLRGEGALAKARCLHFGTHGLSVFESPNEPMEARLLLQDAALDCMDIASLGLAAEIAVISACHSGERALSVRDFGEIPGDDIFGLQSALFQAGVRCVLGTLWLVETESSSAIIKAFHRHYAATGQSEIALQQALRDYLADPLTAKNIFYWAPYFISCLGAAPADPSKSP